jgi:hypothetical protein
VTESSLLRIGAQIVLVLAVASSAAAGEVVVSSTLHPITHSLIACPPSLANDDQRCLANEQSRLNTFVIRDWIHAAADMNGISLSAEEKAHVERRVAELHDTMVRSAKHFRQVNEFVLRIRRGEKPDQVFAAGETVGITRSEIESHLPLMPTLQDAERAVARDPVADADAAVRRNETQKLLIERLQALVQDRAQKQHTTFAVAEQQLWDATIAKIEMRVIDPRYHLPERKGVFDVRKQTVYLHP